MQSHIELRNERGAIRAYALNGSILEIVEGETIIEVMETIGDILAIKPEARETK